MALPHDERWPWIPAIAEALVSQQVKSIAGYSSFKRAHRDFMTSAAMERILFIYPSGTVETLAARLSVRHGHLMNKAPLSSELPTLEVPADDEYSFSIVLTDPRLK